MSNVWYVKTPDGQERSKRCFQEQDVRIELQELNCNIGEPQVNRCYNTQKERATAGTELFISDQNHLRPSSATQIPSLAKLLESALGGIQSCVEQRVFTTQR